MKNKRVSKDDEFRSTVKIKKVKKDIPTVIIVEGRRYVYDPQTRSRR